MIKSLVVFFILFTVISRVDVTNIDSDPFGGHRIQQQLRFGASSNKSEKTLVVICTAMSLWHITEMTLLSLAGVDDHFDTILIDDKSKQTNISKKALSLGIPVLQWEGKEPRGTTNLWNTAWRHAKKFGYDNIIICNNDLLIPNGTIDKLIEGLNAGWGWLVPIVSKRGSPYPKHRLRDHYKLPTGSRDWTDNPLNYRQVQAALDKIHSVNRIQSVSQLNGYMMAFKISLMKQFQYDEFNLFDKRKVNVGNEDQLWSLIRKTNKTNIMGIHPTAFVFHYKGTTVNRNGTNRDNLKEDVTSRLYDI